MNIDSDVLVETGIQPVSSPEEESSFSEPSPDSDSEDDMRVGRDEEDDVEVIFQNSSFPPEQFTSMEREKELITSIITRIHGDWEPGLLVGFDRYLDHVLSTKNPTDKTELKHLFETSLSPYSAPPVSRNPFVYYERMQVGSTRNITYSVICMSLLNASPSEASCERIFSILRYIVGERRRSLTKRRLNDLLLIR